MISALNKSLFLILIVFVSFISCSNRYNFMKKGIVLKCQGNPVSCYGKRSIDFDQKYIKSDENDSLSNENSEMISIENSLDEIIGALASNCNTGDMASCKRLRKIILMSSDK